jgi:competence protein ComEC
MGSIGLYAYKIGRVPYLNRLLLLAGSIMLAFNPLLIKVDLGFILSFVAVLAIANTYFLYKDLLQRIPWRWLKALAAILCVSLVAQIVTWPIISRNFSVISIVAPLANIFVVWLLSGVMIAVLLGIFLSFIFPGLAIWFFLPAKISLTYIFSVSEFFAAGKFASIDYQMENDLFFFVYYFVLILAVCYLKRRKRSF